MKAEHLTPNVRKQVVSAIKDFNKQKKSIGDQFCRTEEEMNQFFNPYFEKVKDEIENNFSAFMELCVLEQQYGFVRGYMGGANVNPNGDTIVKIMNGFQ